MNADTGMTSSPLAGPVSLCEGDGMETGVRSLDPAWTQADSSPDLLVPRDEILLWRVELDAVPEDLPGQLRGLLSPDETARADRFRLAGHARRFVVARGALRCVLAGLLEVYPSELEFGYGPAGKPFLTLPVSGRALEFNVTHSENLALIAITRSGEIGIDVEPLRDLPDWEGVAKLAFDAEQVTALQSCAEPDRMAAFFRAWTRKEAVAKALGTGLGGAELSGLFSVYTFSFSPRWVTSIAARPGVRTLRCHTWTAPVAPDFHQRTLVAPAASDTAVPL